MFDYISGLFTKIISTDNLLKAGETILFIAGGFIILRLIVFILKRVLRRNVSQQYAMLAVKAVNYTGIIIIALAVLNELGINLGIILGTAGVAGIALGFASQTSLSNFISGLFLIAEKTFEIGDVITVGSYTGVVISIDLLAVKVNTFDNRFVRIPNELIIKSELTNVTRFPIRRLDLNIPVAYKDDLETVQQILFEIARENTFCLDNPEPIFLIKEFGSSGIEILFGVWFSKTDYILTKNSMMNEIKARFHQEGIEIPFPHISIYAGFGTAPFPVDLRENTED